MKCVITAENSSEAEKFGEECKSNGFEYTFMIRQPNNKAEIDLSPRKFLYPNAKSPFTETGFSCPACSRVIAINCNGDIYPCQGLVKPDLKICNILQEDWYDTLKSSALTSMFKARSVDNSISCSSCSVKYLCGGGCAATSYNVYGDINAYQDFMCSNHFNNCINHLKHLELES